MKSWLGWALICVLSTVAYIAQLNMESAAEFSIPGTIAWLSIYFSGVVSANMN